MELLGGIIGGILGVALLVIAALAAAGLLSTAFLIVVAWLIHSPAPEQHRLGEQKWPPWKY